MRVAIVGAGGHGRECLGVLEAMRSNGASLEFVGFVDDAPSEANLTRMARLDAPYLGTLEQLRPPDADRVVIGIGSSCVREMIGQRLAERDFRLMTLVHPDATVGLDTELGDGVVVFAGARVTTNVRLGQQVHLNQNVTVGHDSILDDFVTCHPQSAVSGDCQVGRHAVLGAGSIVLPQMVVGASSVVGAGAVVTRTVEVGRTVVGVPAR